MPAVANAPGKRQPALDIRRIRALDGLTEAEAQLISQQAPDNMIGPGIQGVRAIRRHLTRAVAPPIKVPRQIDREVVPGGLKARLDAYVFHFVVVGHPPDAALIPHVELHGHRLLLPEREVGHRLYRRLRVERVAEVLRGEQGTAEHLAGRHVYRLHQELPRHGGVAGQSAAMVGQRNDGLIVAALAPGRGGIHRDKPLAIQVTCQATGIDPRNGRGVAINRGRGKDDVLLREQGHGA